MLASTTENPGSASDQDNSGIIQFMWCYKTNDVNVLSYRASATATRSFELNSQFYIEAFYLRRLNHTRPSLYKFHAYELQISLGVATLLTYVPTQLAASHQGGALAVMGFAFWLTHELRRLPK